MGKNLLVGVGGKARHVKALYVGVGGKARKVKKVYVGVGGNARLVYTSYVACTDLSFTTAYEAGFRNKTQYYGIITITTVPSNATTGTVTVTPYGSWRPAIIESISSNGNTTTVKFYCTYGVSNGLMTVATVKHSDGVTYYINADIDYNSKGIIRIVIDKTLRKNE